MPLTNYAAGVDLYGAIREDAFNNLVRCVMRQRPSLFNYATSAFLRRPDLNLFAAPIVVDPVFDRLLPEVRLHNPLATEEKPLPLPGTNGWYGLEFCAQVTDLQFDAHPGGAFALPPELAPLASQRLALHIQIALGIGFPREDYTPRIPSTTPPPEAPFGLPFDNVTSFVLDCYGVAHMERIGDSAQGVLYAELDGIELVDVQPAGAEAMIESLARLMIRMLTPRIAFALSTLVFRLEIPYVSKPIKLSLSPVSEAVPHNPAVEDDMIKAYIHMEANYEPDDGRYIRAGRPEPVPAYG